MKALAIRQPYAWLIVYGHKEVEYRPWLTHYRGHFFVRANKDIDKQEVEQLRTEKAREGVIVPDDLPRSGFGGIVNLTELVEYQSTLWPFSLAKDL